MFPLEAVIALGEEESILAAKLGMVVLGRGNNICGVVVGVVRGVLMSCMVA